MRKAFDTVRVINLKCHWEELRDCDIIGLYSGSEVCLGQEIARMERLGWELHISYKVRKGDGMFAAIMTKDETKWVGEVACEVHAAEAVMN